MVGRYRNLDGIRVFPKPDFYHPHMPDEIGYEDMIDLKGEERIFILAHRPGIGKTYSILKFLKKQSQNDKDFSFFYFTDRHSSIKEHTKDWKEGTYSHWMGFDKKCTNPYMRKFYKWHLKPKDICSRCGKCDLYNSQFDDIKRVFAPYQYLNLNHFKDNLPDIVFIDENPKQFDSYSINIDKVMKFFNWLGIEDIVELIKNNNLKKLEKKYPYKKIYDDYKSSVLELSEKRTKNKEILEFIEKFNIYDFYQYVHWENIYGYGLLSYGVPNQYYSAFGAVTEGIPVVFMDATFNPYFFSYLLECYNGESKLQGKKGFTNLVVFGFREEIEDLKIRSTIYRMKPEDTLPKTNFIESMKWERVKEWFPAHMKVIMEIFGRNNVGIITFKDLGDFPKALGYNVEYYGNLRGTNLLENKPVLVIIGTYQPIVTSWYAKKKKEKSNDDEKKDGKRRKDDDKEYFDDLIKKYFLLDVNKENLISIGVEAPEFVSKKYDYKLGRTYSQKYSGKPGILLGASGDEIVKHPAEALTTLFWYDEIYQAFHRNRPLRDERIIFSYCWFPEPDAKIYATDSKGRITDNKVGHLKLFQHNLRNEFKKVIKFKEDDINELFDYLSETEYGKGGLIEEIIEYILQHPKVTTKELTEKYKISKTGDKRGADTIPMSDLIRTIRILKDKAKRLDLK